MKVSIAYFSVLAASALPMASAANLSGCLDTSEVVEGKDYFPDKVSAGTSEFWDITYHNTYKILRNEFDDSSYLLYQCGTEPPAEQLDGRHKAVLPVPLSNGVALTQTTMIPHLELLGLRSQIKGYLGDEQYISSPCLNQKIENGDVMVVQDPSDAAAMEPLLSSSGEDLVAFVSEFDSVQHDKQVVISAFREATNTGTYEWNKFYAAFFNLEARANELYDGVTDRYECIAENTAVAIADSEDPVVLWAYYSTYSGGWDVAECPNYYCEFASIASATILNSREGSIEGFQGNKLMTTEEFVEFGKDADFWIFNSYDWDTIYADNKEQLDQMKSVQNQEVYDYQGSGQNAWFEQRLVEFDVVAQDFSSVVGTQNPFHQRVWLRNVFAEEPGTPGECSDVDAPLVSRATECITIPQAKISDSSASTMGTTFLAATVAVIALFLH